MRNRNASRRSFVKLLAAAPLLSQIAARDLYAQAAIPEYQCRFRWEPNSVAMWDNRCAQHFAVWDYYPNVRHGFRVSIVGDRPS